MEKTTQIDYKSLVVKSRNQKLKDLDKEIEDLTMLCQELDPFSPIPEKLTGQVSSLLNSSGAYLSEYFG